MVENYLGDVFEKIARSPRRIVSQTSMALPIVKFEEEGSARDYLRDYTLPFLRSAYIGGSLLDYSRSTSSNAEGILKPETDNTDLENMRASADLAVVIFSYMPDLSGQAEERYTRHGTLAAPRTIIEFQDRIAELQDEVGAVIGKGAGHLLLANRLSLKRMLGFFKTGKLLDIYDMHAAA